MRAVASIILTLLLTTTQKAKDHTIVQATTRAITKISKIDDRKCVRTTIASDLSEDEEKVVVIAEFGNHTLGIYCGYCDEANDQWVIIDQKMLGILKESVERVK